VSLLKALTIQGTYEEMASDVKIISGLVEAQPAQASQGASLIYPSPISLNLIMITELLFL